MLLTHQPQAQGGDLRGAGGVRKFRSTRSLADGMRLRSHPFRCWCFGIAFPAGTGEARVEVRQGLLEADLRGVEFAHRRRQAVLGKIRRRHTAGLSKELDGPERWPVMAIGEHVYVRMRQPPA